MGKGGKDKLDVPEPWLNRVLIDNMVFEEYGLPYDLRELPEREFQAHVALLSGINIKRAETQKEMEKERKKAERRSNKKRFR